MSGGSHLIFWSALGILAGVYMFVRGFGMLQRKRLILNTPTSKIRSASMGLVEINGLAAGPYTMNAPLTGLPCFYYRSLVWQWKQSGKNKEWVKVVDESLHLPFYLDDNTGRLLVNPQGADLDIHRDLEREYSPSFFSSNEFIPHNVSTVLARHGIAGGSEKVKVEEYCIKPKNALFILGTLAENPGLEVSPKPVRTLPANGVSLSLTWSGFADNPLQSALDAIPGLSQTTTITRSSGNFTLTAENTAVSSPLEVIRLTTNSSKPATTAEMTQQQKIAAALTKADITNPAAWAAAGLDQMGPVAVADATSSNGVRSDANSEQFDPRPKVVLMKGDHNPAFFISWRSQKDVVASLGWKSALFIWGGPALSLLCIYLLATRFNLL